MKKLINGRALYLEENRIWIARGLTVFSIDYFGNIVSKKIKLGNAVQRLLSSFRIIRQFLRIGIHHLVKLQNGNLFLTVKNKSFTVSESGKIISTFSGYHGHKPAHQGVCVCPNGTIFFGEYTINLNHKFQTKLFRSTDNGITFEEIYCFDKNIRHIHFIKYDCFANCIWLGTGDGDDECLLMRSFDNGNTWENVGGGSQDWRAIGVCFEKNYLIWGTDAGHVPDQSHIVRMERKTNQINIIQNVDGPCHGCGTFKNNDIFISTGVEGGENERDKFARLYFYKNNNLKEILKFKKDIFPFIIQYGVIRFPLGTENSNKIVFTTFGLKNSGECVYILDNEDKIKQ